MAGLTSAGFEKKTLAEIKSDLEDAFRSTFGAFINLLPGSVFSLIIGIIAERLAEVWDVAEAVYNSQFPDTAEGTSLDGAVAYTGIRRLEATKSTVVGQLLFGDAGTLIPAGTQFSVDGNPSAQFTTNTDVTLIAGTDEVQTIEFDLPPDAGTFTITYRDGEDHEETTAPIAYDANAAAVAAALNALDGLSGVEVTGAIDDVTGLTVTFAGDDGKQPQPLLVVNSSLTDNGNAVDVTVTRTTPGVAQGTVNLTAVETGPVDAPAFTLSVIDTPVSGLDRVLNPRGAVLGRNRETDAELRLRRANTLTVSGAATVEAIRSRLLDLNGVRNVFIFENETLVTDIEGRPGKSFEVVIDGGDDQEIADTIWQVKPAGIQTYGDQTVNVTDSIGITREVSFSRPDPVTIYCSIDLEVDEDLFPENGAALAQSAIVAWGNELGIGGDVIVYPQLVAQLATIPGIIDMVIRIDDSAVSTTPGAPAVDDNVTIAAFEVASFSAQNTTVNIL